MCRRHKPGSTFVSADHQLHMREVDKGVGQRQIAFPRHTIGDIDPMEVERGGENVGGGIGHGGRFLFVAFYISEIIIYSD